MDTLGRQRYLVAFRYSLGLPDILEQSRGIMRALGPDYEGNVPDASVPAMSVLGPTIPSEKIRTLRGFPNVKTADRAGKRPNPRLTALDFIF
jgi:hypothetical protein